MSTLSADDNRPQKILARTPVEEAHVKLLQDLVTYSQELARGDKVDLQAEFGKETVAIIVGCNQFLRLHKATPTPGDIEVLLPADAAIDLVASEPHGMVFKMFGWKRYNPMVAGEAVSKNLVKLAFERARATAKPR